MNRCRRCGDPSAAPRCACCARLDRWLGTVADDVKEAEARARMDAFAICEAARQGGFE